ncbi:MOSC domain-containing protein [Mucilaginibacter litoreus]|uniref:MOSC domain-containing protein n=1 Tax=Mucilaginibacter litoreus TaxID=1048221 RepID=A0ABW3ATB4_9SPHI
MLRVSQLIIYPIKSLGGIHLNNAKVTSRGLEHDRRWMLIDENHRFLSQREHAQLALYTVQLINEGLKVTFRPDGSSIVVPFRPIKNDFIEVSIWDDTCHGQLVSNEIDAWFTAGTGINCRLVYMPDNIERPTDPRYTEKGTITSFSDAYPALLIGEESLNDLNKRLTDPVLMNRFRPNIVFSGGEPYAEDLMKHISINGMDMYGVKLCARCVLTTIDQETAEKGKDPLKTLATYRRKGNKINFGQNLVLTGNGMLNVGDEITVISTHTEERFLMATNPLVT